MGTKKARGGGSTSIAIQGYGISESGEGEWEVKSLSERKRWDLRFNSNISANELMELCGDQTLWQGL
jgi:hypothetical protein